MKKKTIAIIFGGMSCEHSISLQSASAVIANINRDKYNLLLIGITQSGDWYRYDGPADRIAADNWFTPETCASVIVSPSRNMGGFLCVRSDTLVQLPVDAAFPVLHGPFGEDGTVQGLLELAGIPTIGCGTLASALCMDKEKAHKLVANAGFNIPESVLFTKGTDVKKIEQAVFKLGLPVFIKPVSAGSSFGITKVETVADIADAVDKAFQYDTEILIEEAISGFEVGCAVLGSETLFTGIPDEVELADGFFDFTEKYNLITSSIHVPARVSAEKLEEIQQTASAIYQVLGCTGFARVDMFLQPDGKLVFNEVNTIPGFTSHSRYPSMMQAAGLDFEHLLDKLIETVV